MKISYLTPFILAIAAAFPITNHLLQTIQTEPRFIQLPLSLEKRGTGMELGSPIFSKPSTYNVDGAANEGSTKPVGQSTPWPFVPGSSMPKGATWKLPPDNEYDVPEVPVFMPYRIADVRGKPSGLCSWMPFRAIGDAVNAIKGSSRPSARHTNGGVNDKHAAELEGLVTTEEDSAPGVLASGVCPNCGKGPGGWEKVVGWFKGAWGSIKGWFNHEKKGNGN